jgi:hypothetical protein
MKLNYLVYDIREIKKAIDDDSDLDDLWIINKINMYRGIIIDELFALRGEIDQSWAQRTPRFKFEKVNSADDPNVSITSVTLGKYKLPKVISLPDDEGTISVMSGGRIREFSRTDFNSLMLRIEVNEERHPYDGWYARVGDEIYVYPYTIYGQAIIIADDPTSVKIVEDGVERDFDITDEYPLDASLAQRIVLQILTRDLAISDGQIADIINDSQDQLKILTSENAGKVRSNS